MKRTHAYQLAFIAFAVALVVTARASAGEAFRPAAAVTTTPTSASLTTAAYELDLSESAALLAAKAAQAAALRTAESPETAAPLPVTEATVPPTAESSAPAGPAVPVTGPIAATPSPRPAAVAVATSAPLAAATPRPAVAVAATAAPTRAPTPAPTQAPPPPPAATPVATQPPPAAAAPAPSCAATWFCYPRLGIAGPIVPYSDCLGSTDIGDGIRSFTCLSPFYLMGHAYTQFGGVTAWQAGDVVFASGRRFVISSAFVQNSCEPPAAPIAPLSLQTSLTSGGCGRVLVVQGR